MTVVLYAKPQQRGTVMGQKHLTKTHREIIERFLGEKSIRSIAVLLGYSPAAISKEVRRNANKNGRYDAQAAQRRADWRASKDKNAGKRTAFLTAYVQEGLRNYWSPEQIAGRLRQEFPDDPASHISFKSIYRWISKDSKKYEKKKPFRGFFRYLRHKRPGKRLIHGKKCVFPALPCISSRSEEESHGHWECDLVHGNGQSGYILTAVERKSGFLMAAYSAKRTSADISSVIIKLFSHVPKGFFRSITYDQGKEFLNYKQIDMHFGTASYFCHAGCPGERGLNEQTNGLLRQFFPRYRSFKGITQKDIERAVALINHRPRKKFGYKTTVEKMKEDGVFFVSTFV